MFVPNWGSPGLGKSKCDTPAFCALPVSGTLAGVGLSLPSPCSGLGLAPQWKPGLWPAPDTLREHGGANSLVLLEMLRLVMFPFGMQQSEGWEQLAISSCLKPVLRASQTPHSTGGKTYMLSMLWPQFTSLAVFSMSWFLSNVSETLMQVLVPLQKGRLFCAKFSRIKDHHHLMTSIQGLLGSNPTHTPPPGRTLANLVNNGFDDNGFND